MRERGVHPEEAHAQCGGARWAHCRGERVWMAWSGEEKLWLEKVAWKRAESYQGTQLWVGLRTYSILKKFLFYLRIEKVLLSGHIFHQRKLNCICIYVYMYVCMYVCILSLLYFGRRVRFAYRDIFKYSYRMYHSFFFTLIVMGMYVCMCMYVRQ